MKNLPVIHAPGERLIWARKQKGYSQEKLGDEIGCTQTAIQKFEKGKTRRLKNLSKAAEVLDVPYIWLEYGEIRFDEAGETPLKEDALNEEKQEFIELMKKISDPDDMKFLKDQLLRRKLSGPKSDDSA